MPNFDQEHKPGGGETEERHGDVAQGGLHAAFMQRKLARRAAERKESDEKPLQGTPGEMAVQGVAAKVGAVPEASPPSPGGGGGLWGGIKSVAKKVWDGVKSLGQRIWGGGHDKEQAPVAEQAPEKEGGEEKKEEDPQMAAALKILKPGGSGTQADCKLVAPELAKMPLEALKQLDKQGTKVVCCRGSVTDYLTNLKGVHPRGWPPGMTWDTVPGLFNSASNEVVVATIGHGTTKGAHVPATGEGHGSANLTIHEAGHAVDMGAGGTKKSKGADFGAARTKDIGKLTAYELQAGDAGLEETYAESMARHFGGDDKERKKQPGLSEFWSTHNM